MQLKSGIKRSGWECRRLVSSLCALLAVFCYGVDGAELRISKNEGTLQLVLSGNTNKSYLLKYRDRLDSSSPWENLIGLNLRSATEVLSESDPALPVQRFYTLEELDFFAARPYATDFRLIDHQGKSRSLHYNKDVKVILLVFANRENLEISGNREVLAKLKQQYGTRGVLFWLIDSDGRDRRDDIINLGSKHNLDIPLYHDQTQMVAHEYGINAQLEAVAIETETWSVFYKGNLNDASNALPGSKRLESALNQFLNGETVAEFFVKSKGHTLNLTSTGPVSYARDVAPILQKKCIHCHSPGNIGPFAMTNHTVVSDWASVIKEEVLSQRMPPWHADPHYGTFGNDISLSVEETSALVRWINQGAVKDSASDPLDEYFTKSPPAPDYPLTWPQSLGEPDYIVTLPKQDVPAVGHVNYRYVTVPVNLPPDTWIRAAIVLPGNNRVVHHVLVSTGAEYSFLNTFVGYAPGTTPLAFPDGTGKSLNGVTHFSFELHYTGTGTPETDQTRLGLYFHKSPPKSVLKQGFPLSFLFEIPPGAKEYIVPNTSQNFTNPVWLYSMSPHMHYRGLRMKFEAIYPDGKREVLLNVPAYSFEWQTTYHLKEPKYLPAFTRITVSGAFDNSELNHHNPNPSQRVRWGEQTTDEMFIGFLSYSDAE